MKPEVLLPLLADVVQFVSPCLVIVMPVIPKRVPLGMVGMVFDEN